MCIYIYIYIYIPGKEMLSSYKPLRNHTSIFIYIYIYIYYKEF